MQYVDLVIFNGASNDKYNNNAKFICVSIKDAVINAIIKESDWRKRPTFLINGKPLISSATLLNRYSDIIIFQEREKVGIHPREKF